jgi:CHAP domain-containing protein
MRQAIILDPIGMVIEEAGRYMGVEEVPKLSNRGVQIDYWLTECKIPVGNPWCAAFVTCVIRQAIGRASPVYLNGSVQRIVEWAQTLKSLGVWQDKPERGDLFVLYFKNLGRFGHIGLVTNVVGNEYETIEGNSNSVGSREGYGVVKNKRKINENTKFIRWVNTLPDK